MRSREFGVFRMMILLVFVSSFALSSAHTSEKMPTDVAPYTDAYYLFRHASSLCQKSLCRGGFVKLVNHIRTPCIKGAKQHECYISEVDYDRLSLSDAEFDKLMQAVEAGQVLFKGRIQSQPTLGLSFTRRFEVTQAWVAASKKLANGTYYQVTNSKIPCPTVPSISRS